MFTILILMAEHVNVFAATWVSRHWCTTLFNTPSSLFRSTTGVFLFNLMLCKLKTFVVSDKTSVCCEKVFTRACLTIETCAARTMYRRQRGENLQCCSVSYAAIQFWRTLSVTAKSKLVKESYDKIKTLSVGAWQDGSQNWNIIDPTVMQGCNIIDLIKRTFLSICVKKKKNIKKKSKSNCDEWDSGGKNDWLVFRPQALNRKIIPCYDDPLYQTYWFIPKRLPRRDLQLSG